MIADLGLDRDTIYLHAAPMFHLADGAMTMGVLLAGGSHVMIPAFNAEQVMAAVQRHRISHLLLVPTMIHMTMTHPKLAQADLSSLRRLLYGASPIPEALLVLAMRALPNCGFVQAYGQTELSPVATILPSDYHTLEGPKAGKLASAGRAAMCCELEIVDMNGAEAPRGDVLRARDRRHDRRRGAARRRGRDPCARPQHHAGLLEQAQGDGGGAARRLGPYRRCRTHG
jgi:acyl-CoA synthetase (AMP-forming)/AMP-acid ligase II